MYPEEQIHQHSRHPSNINEAVSSNDERRNIWSAALLLPDATDLPTSLIAELARYLKLSTDEVASRCRSAREDLNASWLRMSPESVDAVEAFYRHTNLYLYDLTWWHGCMDNDSALVHVDALDCALDHHANTVLDFGSGIGSLGILFTQHGLEMTMVDINIQLNEYANWRFAQRGLNGTFQLLDDRSWPPLNVDFITAIDTLEHVADLPKTLSTIIAALRLGGILFVHLPPDKDLDRPMHAQGVAAQLLENLAAYGLWLERAKPPSYVLRKGTAPTYILRSNLIPQAQDKAGLLVSEDRLYAIKVNRTAMQVLWRLIEPGTAAQVIQDVKGLSLVQATDFLEGMFQQGVVEKFPAPVEVWPSVSVIIPSRNRPEDLIACMASLRTLDYPHSKLEVIIVDDASQPPLESTENLAPARIMRQEENIGQSAARNLAAKDATGDLLAFLDDDCRATRDWLSQLVPWTLDPAVELVGGRILSYTSTGWLAAYEEARSPLDMGSEASWVGPGAPLAYMPSSNMLIDRRAFLELNGFEPAMRVGEDVDFTWRVASTGRGVRYIPNGIVYHQHRTRLKQFLMRRADYGSSEADLDRRHPEMRRRMQLLPSSLILLFLPSILCLSSAFSLGLATMFGLLILIDLVYKWATQKEFGLRVSVWDLARASLGKHAAALYHLCANLLRYYSLFFLAIGLVWPFLAPMTAIIFCVPPVVDYYRKRPLLPRLAFISIYWLEMFAYQIGVWRGCFQHKRFGPLFPRIKISL